MTSRAFILLMATLSTASAQTTAVTPKIPVRQVAAPDAATKDPIGSVAGLIQYADGHVLVNDPAGKRLIFFDPSLSHYVVTADSAGSGRTLYPSTLSLTGLYYYLGDSAAFTDMTTQSFLIVGPDGTLGRSMAHARATDMRSIAAGHSGVPGFDSLGRFVYRGLNLMSSVPRPTPGAPTPSHTIDTAAIVRADFDRRAVDTIATIEIPVQTRPVITWDVNGKASQKMVINPVPAAADDWAVLSDGSVAVLRPHDYHIDWVYADGRSTATPKMPFDWRRLTDADKAAKIDSVKHLIDSVRASGKIFAVTIVQRVGAPKPDTIAPTIEFVSADQMADYVQPIRLGALRADRDNHLWILPTTTRSAVGGGLLYDVVNLQGEIVERVQLPAGRVIAGFGRGGAIYMSVGDRAKGFTIEKTHVIVP